MLTLKTPHENRSFSERGALRALFAVSSRPRYSHCRLRPESGRAAYPFQVAVVIDTHHDAAAHAEQRQDRRKFSAFGPNVHDANLGLGHAVRCGDHRLKAHPLLQHIVRPLLGGYGIHIGLRGIELDPDSRKRIERLQYIVFVVPGHGAVLVKQPCPGHAGMLEKGNGELADAVVPVGVAGPQSGLINRPIALL